MVDEEAGGSLGVLHAKRPEQTVLESVGQWLAIDLFDDEPEQRVIGVAVFEFRVRGEICLGCAKAMSSSSRGAHSLVGSSSRLVAICWESGESCTGHCASGGDRRW